MSSKRCGCASNTCTCVITGGTGVEVSGSGTTTNPYVLDASEVFQNVVAAGRLSCAIPGTSAAGPFHVPFTVFTNAPYAVCTVSGIPVGSAKVVARVANVATTGMDIYLYSGDGTNATTTVTVDWIAVQIGA
jgi:hypothetical protein